MNTFKFTAAAYSDKGNVRTNNEDNLYFNGIHLTEQNRDNANNYFDTPCENDLVFGVFDGMGGEALGEVASLIAAKTTAKYHSKIKTGELRNDDNTFGAIIREANEMICRKMSETKERRIGTTFAALSVKDNKAKIYNIGDSRVYQFRNGELIQISVDDTSVQRMINIGVLTKEAAKTHKDRHKLTQHLGIFEDEMIIQPHISAEIEIKKGDVFLLCSDGLTDMVEDDKIREIISVSGSCAEAAKRLVGEALKNGGVDNVTVVMISADGSARSGSETSSKKIKYIVFPVITAVLLAAAVFAAVKIFFYRQDDGNPENDYIISLENQPKELYVGESGNYIAKVEPKEASGEIKYSSSDPDVLLINENGKYSALKEGKAIISAKLGELEEELTVSVKKNAEKIELSESESELTVGETREIKYSVSPADYEVKFSSSDDKVAKVEKGIITAVGEGTAEITVAAGSKSETCRVTVKKAETKQSDDTKQGSNNSIQDGDSKQNDDSAKSDNGDEQPDDKAKKEPDKESSKLRTPVPRSPSGESNSYTSHEKTRNDETEDAANSRTKSEDQ